MSALGDLGPVVTYDVARRPSGVFEYAQVSSTGPSHTVLYLRRLWRRQGLALATLEGKYTVTSYGPERAWNGHRVVVDLATGRSVRPEYEDSHRSLWLQISFWRRDARIWIRREYYEPGQGLLDLADLRRMAGVP